MSNELKPCPFCGKEARMCQSNIGGAQILCAECGCGTQYSYKKLEHSIAAWNRRTPSDHLVDANKKVDDNPPLTLEELRDMDGEPAYIVFDDGSTTCALVDACHAGLKMTNHWGGQIVLDAQKAHIRAIYRSKPEEG